MVVVWGLLVSLLAVVVESFFNGLLPWYLPFGLAVGLSIYLAVNRKLGLAALISWTWWYDVIFSPLVPVSLLALLLSWWLWRLLLEQRLAPLALTSWLARGVIWFIFYLVAHWLLSWLPYWLGDSQLYPSTTSSYATLLLSISAQLILLVLGLVTARKLVATR